MQERSKPAVPDSDEDVVVIVEYDKLHPRELPGSEDIYEVPDSAADSDTQDLSHSRDPAHTVAESLGSMVFNPGLDLEQRSFKSGRSNMTRREGQHQFENQPPT